MSFSVLVTVLAKKTFSYRRVPLFVRFMTAKLNYKRGKKAPLIAISHKNRTLSEQRDAITSVFPGASETNKKILKSIAVRLCKEELPCSNSPRVCAMAATFWRNICICSEGQRKWTGQRLQYSSYWQL
ncbi:hypothetical protein AVEN_274045-1 [Araneus ventricosus]|uniref:Uncharacterized protein n=1 Tax=Araneus ventricosus TaxID=182803 RepID=A0A4Y2QR64_ARAVE|nr:hypothetical protein AVEN_274045-1 [Araneus ventricosus]